jgi:hypothetical protein
MVDDASRRMSAACPPETRPATAQEAGRTCPYCRFAFKEGALLSLCPACHAAHHEECWGDNQGCAIVGCTAVPPSWMTRTRSDQQQTLTEPVPPPPPAFTTTATTAAAPPPQGARRLTPLVAVLIIGALAATGAAAAVVATKKDSGSTAAASQQTLTQPEPTPTGSTTAPAPEPATDPTPQHSPAEQKHAVVAVLHQYEAAYSSHDIDQLRAIMQPSVTRHGLSGDGCSNTTGRAAVLQTYAEQFALGTGTYTLHGLYSGSVDLNDLQAIVSSTYSIGGGGTGNVRFDLRRFPVGWRISRVDASC